MKTNFQRCEERENKAEQRREKKKRRTQIQIITITITTTTTAAAMEEMGLAVNWVIFVGNFQFRKWDKEKGKLFWG